jgi:hypothetical protein
MPEILFAVESAESRSLPLNAQRLVNFFTEKEPQGAKSQTPLFGAPGMSAFANTSTILGAIAGTGAPFAGGSGYATNTFQNVPLTGGSGSGATANITISGGAVTTCTLAQPGTAYKVGDVLSASNSFLGGTGSGFSITVNGIGSQGIAAIAIVSGGRYANQGAFSNVPLTGGSGSGATANMLCHFYPPTGLFAVDTVGIVNPGGGFNIGDLLSANSPPLPANSGAVSLQVTTLTGSQITSLTSLQAGSGYNSAGVGAFKNVPLTGGHGSGAIANITVTSGAVSGVAVIFPGINYDIGDVLSCSNSFLGGSGSGFSITVTSVDIPGSSRGSWLKQDVPYVVAGNSLYQLAQSTLGTFFDVPLTGGSGSGATANIGVTAGVITLVSLQTFGINFQVGDLLSAPLGGGTGFSISVASLTNPLIASLGAITGGAGYVNGTYYGVPLTGGSGAGATATVAVSNGAIGSVLLATLGTGYVIGDVLSASNVNLGGSGSGFSVPVATVNGAIASLAGLAGGSGYVVGVATIVGSGIGASDIVSMSDNGFQLCIVSGAASAGWIFDTNPQSATYGFQQITDPNFYPANTVCFFDGYFVFDRMGTNEMFVSNLYDGTTFNGLNFASAESQPDFITGTVQNLQLLFVICQEHLELWYDAGISPGFPFARYTGAGISYGCVSPKTIFKQDGAIFFLGADKIFYRLQSTVPIRVSTHSVEHVIAQDGDITQAYCFTYTLEGHKFVILTLPVSKRTLVFDISTNRWHDRESWDANNASLGVWRATTAFRAFNNTYLGDAFNGNVNLLDWTTYTELGNTIRGLAYSIPYNQDRKRLFFSRFELDIQAGVGTAVGPGSNPQIQLGWSVDGANTFTPLQFWRSMGKMGQFLTRLRWLRMGNGRQFVFVVSCTDPVPRVIIGAHADISVGM